MSRKVPTGSSLTLQYPWLTSELQLCTLGDFLLAVFQEGLWGPVA